VNQKSGKRTTESIQSEAGIKRNERNRQRRHPNVRTWQNKFEFEPNPPDTPRARTTHLQRIPMMMERPCITWKRLDQFAAILGLMGLFGVGGPSRIASTLRAILKIGGLDRLERLDL